METRIVEFRCTALPNSLNSVYRFIGYNSFFNLVKFLRPMSRFALPVSLVSLLLWIVPSTTAHILSVIQDTPQEQIQRILYTRMGQSGLLALEGAVDPNEYVIGPGDVFNVMIGSVVPVELPLTVSVSGVLPLPEVGPLQASGKFLSDVIEEALILLESRYANAPVSISLVQARSFYVHITGAVSQTGRFLMLPRSRLSDVIQQSLSSEIIPSKQAIENTAVDFTRSDGSMRPEINDVYQPALRNIRIQHRDGTEDLIDFTRYQTTGNIEHNPVLQDGDRINVPAYHQIREGVRISGDVTWPGNYDWRPDDTVSSLLDLAMGGRLIDKTIQFRLLRWSNGDYLTILDESIGSLKIDSIATQAILPEDHVTIFELETSTAIIEGWVTYPGEYRIEGGVTTLSQLVKLAGGLKENANPNAAVLERTSLERLVDAKKTSLTSTPIQLNAGDLAVQSFSEGFQKSFSGNVGSQVAIDITGALSGTTEDIVLYDGDRLIFPRDEGTVFVTGHVPLPGYVKFLPGMTANHYVERAGGLGPGAEGVYIYDGSSGTVRRGLDVPIRSGDTIFVDWLEQLTVSSRQVRSQQIQVIFTSISAATGVAATIIALLR